MSFTKYITLNQGDPIAIDNFQVQKNKESTTFSIVRTADSESGAIFSNVEQMQNMSLIYGGDTSSPSTFTIINGIIKNYKLVAEAFESQKEYFGIESGNVSLDTQTNE